jgi:hypothetical protein
MPIDGASRYALASNGPDTDIDTYSSANGGGGADNDDFEVDSQALRLYPGYSQELFTDAGATVNSTKFRYIEFDPTNGTVSNGDIFRLSDHSPK